MAVQFLKLTRWCLFFALVLIPTLLFSHHHCHHCCDWGDVVSACDFDCCMHDGEQLDVTTVHGTMEGGSVLPGGAFQAIEIKADQGQRLTIWLAPSWYLKERQIELKVGDHLTVTYAKLSGPGEARYVATELVLQNGTSLKLRDNSGFPLWNRGYGHCCGH